jgi:hypothetical protein
MRKAIVGVAVAVALLLGGVMTVAVEAAPTAVDVTVTGQNYSVIGTLAKDQAADALAGLAELNALKVTSAKGADGKEIADLKGKTLYYVPVKSAEALALGKAHQGKNVEVKGKLFKAENALLVGEFKPAAAAAAGDDFDELPTKTVTRQQVL